MSLLQYLYDVCMFELITILYSQFYFTQVSIIINSSCYISQLLTEHCWGSLNVKKGSFVCMLHVEFIIGLEYCYLSFITFWQYVVAFVAYNLNLRFVCDIV